MTTRRQLLMAFGASALAVRANAVLAQSTRAPVLIAWLSSGSRDTGARALAAFKEGLAALGWKESSNYMLEGRWAEGQTDWLSALARELAALRPAVIVTGLVTVATAAAKAAPTTPIVLLGGDPVTAGLRPICLSSNPPSSNWW